MYQEVNTLISSETLVGQSFDELVEKVFADCTTLEDFFARFAEFFPSSTCYLQENYQSKLDPAYLETNHQISCAGACLLLEAFVRLKLKDQFKVVFVQERVSSHQHSLVVVIPREIQDVPSSEDFFPWLIQYLSSQQQPAIQVFDFKNYPTHEQRNNHAFKPTDFVSRKSRESYTTLLQSNAELIKSYQVFFQVEQQKQRY
jgi:hypothetical protein